MGRVFQRGDIWWVAYSYRGKEIRESSKSAKKTDADNLLKKRLGEIGRGRLIGPTEEKVTFEMIATDFETDRAARGEKSLRDAKERISHLKSFFSSDRAVDITTPRIREFIRSRREDDKASPATVNRDLAALSRMFSLAIQARRLTTRPHIPKLLEAQPRQGFFEDADYIAVRGHLPSAHQSVLDFAYFTGWRKSEITLLEWTDVDLEAGVVRLRPELSKNRQGRTLDLVGPLKDVLERQGEVKEFTGPDGEQGNSQFVFHVKGRPIGDWRKRWATACKNAGIPTRLGKTGNELPGRMLHDLRRTAVRNYTRAGVPERVAMAITGHLSRSVFDRCNIVSGADLRNAVGRLAEYVEVLRTAPNVVKMRKTGQGRN